MNVYLGTTELDNVALQSTGLDAIHLGTEEVWSQAPSTLKFTFGPAALHASYGTELNNWYGYSGQSIFDICNTINYILIGSDGYLYCAYGYTINWSSYYLECMKLNQEMDVIIHIQVPVGNSTGAYASRYTFNNGDIDGQYIDTWKENVDSSITDFQTLGEWIYNNLQ